VLEDTVGKGRGGSDGEAGARCEQSRVVSEGVTLVSHARMANEYWIVSSGLTQAALAVVNGDLNFCRDRADRSLILPPAEKYPLQKPALGVSDHDDQLLPTVGHDFKHPPPPTSHLQPPSLVNR